MPAMATETAEQLASSLNLDLMTTQSSYAVTQNLSLTTAKAQVEAGGGSIRWISSDTNILSVSDNVGLINRPQDKETTVTLTAKVTKNGETASKAISFTVLPISTFVFE